jgi:threonine/homoserine/homoserine lactone efflux protein
MSAGVLVLFLVTEIALALVPGPAVLFTLGTGLRHGLRAAVGANLGVLTGNAIYFAASAFGLGVLLAHAQPLFIAMKWLGAAYLVWLALGALRARVPEAPADGAAPTAAPANGSAWQAWRAATLLQLGNPKAILFFTALLPQFVRADAGWSVPLQILVLGIISAVAEFFVLFGYGALAARVARGSRDPRLLQTFERVSGVCLLGCAALALAA